MKSASELPPELYDCILDYFSEDKSTLRTCALVTRKWLPRARYHLFRSIYIDWSNCDAFTRLLASSPDLGASVATLEIEGAFGIFSMDRLHGVTLDAWLRSISPSFPPQLTNLTKLELALITIDAELVRRFFGRLSGISHLTLWACALTSFDVFVELFASFPALKRLSIAFTQEWETNPRRPVPVPESAVLPHIEVVDLTSCCDNFKVLQWFVAHELHTAIHTFSCSRVPWSSIPVLRNVLGALAPTLRSLKVGLGENASAADDLPCVSWAQPQQPIFTPLSALTTVTLDIQMGRLALAPFTLLLLVHLPMPALQTLTFAVKCGEYDATDNALCTLWMRMAAATASVARAANGLERVVVSARERGEDGGAAGGGYPHRGGPAFDFKEMEKAVADAFVERGLGKLFVFERKDFQGYC
ncbi:hypothetical protein GSI_02401 [Ganoderma sinense ZZ0214-1]|uniref:Beta/gamma crystallin 'Greek key' domain-containing protein n=1 Tax=Ganoderma sinense ZZ0214-1 TaxID=1077348 RepID=A0A2G8SPH2_9APHY|nr:hypothetical protein GSI_02401 [Ganoderma sinense ZZ0214-1]